MEEIGEIESVPDPEPEPIAVNGNGGKLEQEREGEERVEDLIEEVEPEEIERDSSSNSMNDDTIVPGGGGATAAARDAGDSDQELDELLDGMVL